MPADLWRFAEVFYRRPGVETACLQLQDQGADVCLLLCAIWLDQRGAACTPERAERLRATAAPWQHEVVGALRQVRQRWRAAAAHDGALTALREQVKRLELEAEREQLQRLATLASDWPAEAGREPHAWLNAMSATLAATGR
ncbi:TIGR02444 family protein, partial [Pseudomonas sp. CrR25]|nr:TIGR02444 family protein [Pseudomonas sp. CrR25]